MNEFEQENKNNEFINNHDESGEMMENYINKLKKKNTILISIFSFVVVILVVILFVQISVNSKYSNTDFEVEDGDLFELDDTDAEDGFEVSEDEETEVETEDDGPEEVSNNNSNSSQGPYEGPAVGYIVECEDDENTVYDISFNAYDFPGNQIVNNEGPFFCNNPWDGSSSEGCVSTAGMSCETIYASDNNIYGKPSVSNSKAEEILDEYFNSDPNVLVGNTAQNIEESPAFIKNLYQEDGEWKITVDYIQLVPGDYPAPDVINENPLLRTFIVTEGSELTFQTAFHTEDGGFDWNRQVSLDVFVDILSNNGDLYMSPEEETTRYEIVVNLDTEEIISITEMYTS